MTVHATFTIAQLAKLDLPTSQLIDIWDVCRPASPDADELTAEIDQQEYLALLDDPTTPEILRTKVSFLLAHVKKRSRRKKSGE